MDIEVQMAQMKIARDPDNLIALGIGSCIVISFYDPKLKIGALAHCMLPDSKQGEPTENPIKFADTAIDEMLKKIEAQGTKRKDLEAKIIGGANMFSAFESDIGKGNVLCAKKKLKKEAVKLVGECVGGSQGRTVELSLSSGIVTVKTKF